MKQIEQVVVTLINKCNRRVKDLAERWLKSFIT